MSGDPEAFEAASSSKLDRDGKNGDHNYEIYGDSPTGDSGSCDHKGQNKTGRECGNMDEFVIWSNVENKDVIKEGAGSNDGGNASEGHVECNNNDGEGNAGSSGNSGGDNNSDVSGGSNAGVGEGRNRRRNGGRKTGGRRRTRHEAPLSKCIDCKTTLGPFFWVGSDAGDMNNPRCHSCHEIKIALLARRNRKVSRAIVENYFNELLDAHGLPGAQRPEESEDEAWMRLLNENYEEATTCREIIVDIDELDASCPFRHIPSLPDATLKDRHIPLSYDELSLYSYCLKVCPLVARLM